jgi:hypothetical protein
MPDKKQPTLEYSKEILTAEFEYIAGTASQANEDRARVSSFYLIAVGSLVAALFSTQLVEQTNTPLVRLVFSGLFLLLTSLGTTTILQLARLRASWYESILALNQIKEYVIKRDKELAEAFRWQSHNIPPLYKVNSISYQQTLEVAFLCGITFGAAVFFFQSGIGYDCPRCNWSYSIASAAFVFLFELFIYKLILNKKIV